ncbi:MAG: hypothetical protein AAB286_05460, partial [Pseudomonadota bacterium]
MKTLLRFRDKRKTAKVHGTMSVTAALQNQDRPVIIDVGAGGAGYDQIIELIKKSGSSVKCVGKFWLGQFPK